MPLPLMSIWLLEANGFALTLNIRSVDAAGNVQGEVVSGPSTLPLQNAVFDEDSKELRFVVTLDNGEIQTFQGFLFDQTVVINNEAFNAALAGIFTGDRFEDPRRPGFGWFALQTGNQIG